MGVKRGSGKNASTTEKGAPKIRRSNASQKLVAEDPTTAWSEAISDMTPHVQRFRQWWKLA